MKYKLKFKKYIELWEKGFFGRKVAEFENNTDAELVCDILNGKSLDLSQSKAFIWKTSDTVVIYMRTAEGTYVPLRTYPFGDDKEYVIAHAEEVCSYLNAEP